ncbi:MAG: nuclear transport factor 2 family protein [Alphaproteobacteria bacterium]|nr:nuclear transport factor 2 family protein [Alphaproteobacteria bacterium]
METIEQRLDRLEREVALQRDEIQIRQLIASYSPKVDTSDRLERSRLLAELWTEDGVYDIGGIARVEGREAIAQVFVGMHFEQVREGVCHVMGLPFIRIDGDTALALNYSVVMRPDGAERFFPWRVSMNRWDLVRQGGKWLIRHRLNRLMTGEEETRAALRDIDAMAASADSFD